jgi:hypothetical protein
MHQNGKSGIKTEMEYQKYCQTFNEDDQQKAGGA